MAAWPCLAPTSGVTIMQHLATLLSALNDIDGIHLIVMVPVAAAIAGSTPAVRVWRFVAQSVVLLGRTIKEFISGALGFDHPFFKSKRLIRLCAHLSIFSACLLSVAVTLSTLPVMALPFLAPDVLGRAPTALLAFGGLIMGWSVSLRLNLVQILKARDQLRSIAAD